jgi:hypothetical protein
MKPRAFNLATDFAALTELWNEIASADSSPRTSETEQRDLKDLYEKYGQYKQWVIEQLLKS